jgi:site-specific DNA-adenine methylase
MIAELLPLIPRTHAYVEPFGGAGSVLLSRPTSPIEVYNDLDGALAILFRVIRDPDLYDHFMWKVTHTLYARASQNEAIDILTRYRESVGCEDCKTLCMIHDPPSEVELAWAYYVQQNQSVVASTHRTYGQWARCGR